MSKKPMTKTKHYKTLGPKWKQSKYIRTKNRFLAIIFLHSIFILLDEMMRLGKDK